MTILVIVESPAKCKKIENQQNNYTEKKKRNPKEVKGAKEAKVLFQPEQIFLRVKSGKL